MIDDQDECFCEWADCWQCMGDGQFDLHDDDPINYTQGKEFETCGECGGHGGWRVHQGCPSAKPESNP